jgi:hypothetical protein
VISTAVPKILQPSSLPGKFYESDRIYYALSADNTRGDFLAFLAFAAQYGHPIIIHDCPDLAAFQAAHPSADARPFSVVPAAIFQ